ncbi:aspartyl-phosphate phosphatase Spo0E family protein [Falsibacillus albus]|uniref:Aspartyl-phosphate phosphatase Spo0E family protein n=2 Tax=Falsibacillus albus TaxID=2478915 RepID=A0A3L7K3K4_9BACI|nr:aspartyl-phosphate phosphatase Spo0E family protein [Falsibacillus albus]
MDIELVREKMIQTGLEKGLTHHDTLRLSVELDRLLQYVQKLIYGEK